MPDSTQAPTHLVLMMIMTCSFVGLLLADVFVEGYTVRLLVLIVPLAFISVLLRIPIPTPWGRVGKRVTHEDGDDE